MVIPAHLCLCLVCVLTHWWTDVFFLPRPEPPPDTTATPSWEERAVTQTQARIQEILESPAVLWPRGEAAAPAAGQHGAPAPGGMVRAMFAAPDAPTRVRAVELWACSQPREPDLLLAALEDQDASVRRAAAQALSQLDETTLAEQVLYIMRNPLSPGAQTLGQALPGMQDALERPLIEVLENAEAAPERRWAAGYCLGRMGSAKAAPALAQCTGSQDPVLARVCAEALAKSSAPQDCRFWAGLASHPSPEVRRVALDALAALGTPEAINVLHRAALGETETDLSLKEHAVRRIAELPRETAIPILVHVLANHLPARREAARQLKALTGLEFGENPVEWQQWYQQTAGRLPPPQAPPPETAPLYEFAPWPEQ
ncbi:MAG: HEAT repeat domain-containing protein [Candidatus Hydrogenedentes bacterium]|nr:HEAT repeat domain-containing protein [Candidatus Hydrogenedentota bacterium]